MVYSSAAYLTDEFKKMPIYEYQCKACSHQLEVLQKMSDEPMLDCPSCGEPKLNKKISAVAFRLKGGGWYETDFKTGDKKNLAGDAGQSSSAESPSTSAKSSTDSKNSKTPDKSTSSTNSPAAGA